MMLLLYIQLFFGIVIFSVQSASETREARFGLRVGRGGDLGWNLPQGSPPRLSPIFRTGKRAEDYRLTNEENGEPSTKRGFTQNRPKGLMPFMRTGRTLQNTDFQSDLVKFQPNLYGLNENLLNYFLLQDMLNEEDNNPSEVFAAMSKDTA